MAENFGNIALIGVGLINGSLALGLKQAGAIDKITGYARRESTLQRALELGLIDGFNTDPVEAVRGANIVVLGTPPAAMGEVAKAIAPGLQPGSVVTDVGSVKQAVIDLVQPHLPSHSVFVPGHPVAGTEHSGPDAAFSTLFNNRRCILTPQHGETDQHVEKIAAMWRTVGSHVDVMAPAHHDKILAITSHLPHLIAYTIVGTVADLEDQDQTEVFKFAAGGFTDFTRIAGSDPTMWRDVFLNNKDAVLEMLGRFSEDLSALQRAIRWGDGEILFDLFTRTRAIRRGVIDAGQAYIRQPEDPLAQTETDG